MSRQRGPDRQDGAGGELRRRQHCAFLLDYENADPAERGRLRQRTSFAQHNGKGTDAKRQEAPHAHCIITDPAGKLVLIADLGLDKIILYSLDAAKGALGTHRPPYADLTAGAGPRHLAFHPNGKYLYCINELNSSVTAFRYNADKGSLTPFQMTSTLPKKFKGENTAAEVAVHPSGKFLYGSNRGHNSIAAFKIDEQTGRLTLIALQTKNIKTPRNFAIDPSGTFLLVANQDADNVVVFRIDPKTGTLTETGVTVPVPRPVCIKMVPRNP